MFMYLSAAATIVFLLVALMFRLTHPVLKKISHADDMVTWLVTRVPLPNGRPLPFEVLAASEFVGREIREGPLALVPGDPSRKLTYHDACKLARHGGIIDEPRAALKALGVDFRESSPTSELNWCCGGGAGTFLINRAAPLRHKAWQIKRAQVEATGAETVVLPCASCRLDFMEGDEVEQSGLHIESLIELVVAQLTRIAHPMSVPGHPKRHIKVRSTQVAL